MAVKFHEKNKAVFLGLQASSGSGYKIATGTATLSGVAITGTAGQFSCTAANLYIGQTLTISGTLGGTGTITGYVNPTTYYIVATNGTTTFTLSTTKGGVGVTTTAGTPTGLTYTTASLTPTEAFACTEVSSDATRETGSFAYLGDALSRDEYTYTKDTYVNLGLTTFQQILNHGGGTLSLDPNTDSIWKALQLCGGNVIVDTTAKEVYVDNALDSPDYGTVDVRFASPDDATNDKLYKFWDLRGTVDVNASLGDVPQLKFTLNGNADDPVAATKQATNVGNQVKNVASSILPATIKVATLLDITSAGTYNSTGMTGNTGLTVAYTGPQVIATVTSHGGTVGSIMRIRVSGASNATINGDWVAYVLSSTKLMWYVKNLSTTSGTITGVTVTKEQTITPATLCFSTLTAANFFGFDFQRYLTGCDQGFAKGATPTDVGILMLEDQVGGTAFNPDANVSKFYAAVLKFGGASAGTTVAYMWDKIQIANVKEGKVGTYQGRDVSFRNTGSSFIFYQ